MSIDWGLIARTLYFICALIGAISLVSFVVVGVVLLAGRVYPEPQDWP